MHESLHTLQTEGVAMVPYPEELQQKVTQAAGLWNQFCSLPLDEKLQLATNDQGAGTGYEYQTNTGNHTDCKENFDVAATHRPYLEALLASSAPNSTPARFAHAALELADALGPLALRFAEQAETEFRLPNLTHITEASRDNIFIRFLHYFGDRTTGEVIAQPHTDQSGFTFHLYETDKGCQRLDYRARQWIDMPVKPDHAAVFPAMQLQYLSNGELRALNHRVIATEQTRELGRSAIVCFVRLANTPVYDKPAHGRLQERTPGFNYDIPADEFNQLFTSKP